MSVENNTNARGVILAPPHQTAEILALLDDLSAVMHALAYELQELRRAIDEKSQTVLPGRMGGVMQHRADLADRLLQYEMEDVRGRVPTVLRRTCGL